MKNCKEKQPIKTRLDDAAFLLPSMIVFIPVVLLPFLFALLISFTKWDGISSVIEWNGIANFIDVIKTDVDFRNAAWVTTKLTLCITLLSNIFGLLFAVLLTNNIKIREFGRTAFILPNIMSGVILGYIWKFIFTRFFPAVGKAVGGGVFGLSWLGTPQTAFWAIVIVSVWQWSGYTMLIYIAGINGISEDVWEAARLDGATGLQRFFRITMPLIMPCITICIFWTIVKSFTMFDLPYALTEGGPFRSTETISMNIYSEAFTKNNYGLGSAKSILFFVAILVISRLQVYFTRKQEVEL